MNLLLVLVIIGLCIAHFGFWTVVGGFFSALLWIVVIVLLVIAFIYAIVFLLEMISP